MSSRHFYCEETRVGQIQNLRINSLYIHELGFLVGIGHIHLQIECCTGILIRLHFVGVLDFLNAIFLECQFLNVNIYN